jgi:hypothetical protein
MVAPVDQLLVNEMQLVNFAGNFMDLQSAAIVFQLLLSG